MHIGGMRCSKPIFAVALALACAPLFASPSHAQMSCIADWSEAGSIVRREGLAPMEHVGRLMRERSHAQIMRSTLCRENDRFVYRLTVRGGEGTIRTLVVDARNPFHP